MNWTRTYSSMFTVAVPRLSCPFPPHPVRAARPGPPGRGGPPHPPPHPPLRLSGSLARVLRKRRGGRGSKEAGGGPAPPCLLRSTSPPPARAPQIVEFERLTGGGGVHDPP